MSHAEKALAKLEMFPRSDCRHAQANEACDCAVDTVSDLAPSLAAVARAAMAVWNGVCTKGCVEEDHGSMRDLVAALDALEAAAKEVQS